jgi:hypothetical protein
MRNPSPHTQEEIKSPTDGRQGSLPKQRIKGEASHEAT